MFPALDFTAQSQLSCRAAFRLALSLHTPSCSPTVEGTTRQTPLIFYRKKDLLCKTHQGPPAQVQQERSTCIRGELRAAVSRGFHQVGPASQLCRCALEPHPRQIPYTSVLTVIVFKNQRESEADSILGLVSVLRYRKAT